MVKRPAVDLRVVNINNPNSRKHMLSYKMCLHTEIVWQNMLIFCMKVTVTEFRLHLEGRGFDTR
jgi:hypothetical protein